MSNAKNNIISVITAVVGFVLVLFLIGGGALLASRKWDPQWNPFRPKPAKEIPLQYK